MRKLIRVLFFSLSACSSQVSLGSQEEGAVPTLADASTGASADAPSSSDTMVAPTIDAATSLHDAPLDAHASGPATDGHSVTDASPDAPDAAHYNGCAGKGCGVACTVCDPHDTSCVEPPGAKQCNPHEMCVTALICP
jgi:hypothetical protein